MSRLSRFYARNVAWKQRDPSEGVRHIWWTLVQFARKHAPALGCVRTIQPTP